MDKTYNALEGDLTISGSGLATRTGATNAVAIVGGYDNDNASDDVTAGESTLIDDPTGADQTFGVSEISRNAPVVSANGVGTIYGIPVPETSETESFTATQSMSLSNTPIFDPTVHPDHSITVTNTSSDTDLDTNIVYSETVSTPSEEDTANINPITGTIETDSSSDYDVSYTYGDYQSAISTAVDLDVRGVITLTESPSVKGTLKTELSNVAQDFDFKRGFVGARPNIDSSSIGSYTPDEQDWRIVEVAPARATGADGAVRTASAVGGFMSAQPIGPDGSGLYDTVSALTSLNKEYRPSEVKGFEGVTALTRNGVVGNAVTTSSTEQFKNIYATEIIDALALNLFESARDYAGGPQDPGELETELEIVCQNNSRGNPPLLGFGDGRSEEPYDVNTTLGSDTSVANAGIAIVPYPIAEQVNLSMTVSDGFVQFDGATA